MNIKEVARLAGVSTATVSRTINSSDKVTPETAERVKRAIEELKFYPNTNARALGSGSSRSMRSFSLPASLMCLFFWINSMMRID